MKTKYNVIIFDHNKKIMYEYDIIPVLFDEYNRLKNKPKGFEEVKNFIIRTSRYNWWSKCEYEIIISDWPCQQVSEKIDVHRQIMNNIDVITEVFIKNLE